VRRIHKHVRSRVERLNVANPTCEEKSAFAERLAKQLELDYDALIEKRIMHLLSPEEVTQLAAAGADIQLHTHRHRVPLDRTLFLREIEDNGHSIQAMTGLQPHFCYPSGVYDRRFLPWLCSAGIRVQEHWSEDNDDTDRRHSQSKQPSAAGVGL
jgi:hypothetical protein